MSSYQVPMGGGIFHTAKVNYSPETKTFLKELMDESKMTMMQRQKINYSLRSGDPLPKQIQKPVSVNKKQPFVIRPGSSRRRSYDTIKMSGCLEPSKFVSSKPASNREQAKKHLQDMMTYGKELNLDAIKPKKEKKKPRFSNRYEELRQEIQDRVEWLADMEKLGEAYKHRQYIEQQIATRVHEMESLQILEDDGDKPKKDKDKEEEKKGKKKSLKIEDKDKEK